MMQKILYEFINKAQFQYLLKQKKLHFNLNQKTILFIEPYGSTHSLLKRGLDRGWNVIILSANSDLRIVPRTIIDIIHLAIKIDTTDEQSVMELAALLHEMITLHAVIPGFEYFVPIAAKISHELNLPGIHPQRVMSFRRKDFMRTQLQQAGINVPRFFILHDIQEMDEAWNAISFPLICKPIDAAGSVKVKKVNNKSAALTHGLSILSEKNVLWGHRVSNCLLIEEYIEGNEYSVEGVIMGGKITYFSITKKILYDQSDFVEISHIIHPPLSTEMKQLLENYVAQVITVLGANYCPFHAEVRITSDGVPFLMEIAARLPGDHIGDLITFSRKENYFDYVFAAYMGEYLPFDSAPAHPVGIRFFYRPKLECFSIVQGLEQVALPIKAIKLYYQPGEYIPDFPLALRRLGYVIIQHENYAHLCQQLLEIDKHIQFS